MKILNMIYAINKKNKACINSVYENHILNNSIIRFGCLKNSDIDFWVKFRKIDLEKYFDRYITLKEGLKSLFKKEICLVQEQTLKSTILINSMNKNREFIYK
jgi:predicted nucleotidyltransferase